MPNWPKADDDVLLHFFGASQDLLCIANLDGFFQRLNPAWSKTLGFTEEELVARPFLDFVHPDDREATIAETLRLRAGENVVWFHNRYRCRDGSHRWLLWQATPDLERGLIYAIAHDATEQRRLEDELHLMSSWQRAILDSANFAIISCRPDGIIQTINAGALAELGYSAGELVGKATPEVIHDHAEVEARAAELSAELGRTVAPGFEAFVAKARMGQPDEHEWSYIRKDGSRFPVLLSVTAMRDATAGIVGFLGIGTNLTERKRAEAAKRNLEEQMQALMDNASAVIFMKSVGGRYMMVNRKHEEIFHMPRQELLGKTDQELFPPELARVFQENDRQVVAAGGPLEFEEIAPHDDGLHTYVSVKFPLYDPAGRVSAVCGIATDITKRKRTEEKIRESEARLRAILDNAVEGIITMGEDRVIQSFNLAAERMFGYTAAEIIGQNVNIILRQPRGAGTGQRDEFDLRAGDGRTLGGRREVEGRHRDGTIFPIEISVSEIPEAGGGRLFTGMVHDISERKQAEANLLRSNADLQQFAYVASHDLKEPLRMVSSYLQLIERRYKDKLDNDGREFIGFAVDGAQRMGALIEDLLEFSRVDTRGKVLVPTESAVVLRLACQDLRPAIEESGATLTQDETLPVVLADATQLRQVFQNLIANALKFRGTAPPQIHIGARRESGRWIFSVSDNGIGIEERFFERIFVIFQRLHTRDHYPGTGIGLALCKKIVERHGGRIWVESKLGEGTKFLFSMEDAENALASDWRPPITARSQLQTQTSAAAR